MPSFENKPDPGTITDPSHYDPQCEPNHFGGGNAVASFLGEASWPSYGVNVPAVDPVHTAPFIDPLSRLLGH